MINLTKTELDWLYAAISQELDEFVCADFSKNAEIIANQHDLLAKIANAYVLANLEEKIYD